MLSPVFITRKIYANLQFFSIDDLWNNSDPKKTTDFGRFCIEFDNDICKKNKGGPK